MDEGTPKKIMIVDDEETSVFFLSRILERSGYAVVSTSKSKEALALAEKERPDLIILDIVMPEMNGGDVAAQLDEKPATADIPIIYLSAILSKQEQSLIQKSGKHHIVAKPVTGTELLSKIEKVLAEA